ncbi:MAG: enoyl-CoA hydratase/isomerase family protein [Rhodospirillales bacterium]|nr:enoyl-CoA hydratase/isomerase family protein [Rhodospirillales bacterium]
MSESQFQDILYSKTGHRAQITINRPEVLNAFRRRTYEEFCVACGDASMDINIGVVVITGAGSRAFSSGGDVKGYQVEPGGQTKAVGFDANVYETIRKVTKPTIAMVRGWCVGGANVLAAQCDMTIASETARFGQNGPRMGSYNPWGFSYMARVVGEKKAREIWFLCRQYTAQQALEMGLVNKVVPDDQLEAEVDQWCEEILALSPSALEGVKRHFQVDSEHIQGYWDLGSQALRWFMESPEGQEGVQAFLEKRKPDFWKFRVKKEG